MISLRTQRKLTEPTPRFQYRDEDHSYWYDLQRLTSVTTLAHHYAQSFDEDKMSKRVADRRGVAQDEVLEEWAIKRKVAADLGTAVHNEAESMAWKMHNCDCLEVSDYYPQYDERTQGYLKAVVKFYLDHPEIICGYSLPECKVFSPDDLIAGTVDLICNYDGDLTIVDWKTSARIDLRGYGMMQAPVEHLYDCNLTHYNLQLATYRHILATHYDLPIERLIIVHLKANGHYHTHDLPLRTDEVKDILHDHKNGWYWDDIAP